MTNVKQIKREAIIEKNKAWYLEKTTTTEPPDHDLFCWQNFVFKGESGEEMIVIVSTKTMACVLSLRHGTRHQENIFNWLYITKLCNQRDDFSFPVRIEQEGGDIYGKEMQIQITMVWQYREKRCTQNITCM